MSFSYKKFINTIYSKFKDDFSLDEIEELLSVNNEYERDNKSEKRLLVNRIKFNGIKPDKKEFEFDKTFTNGVNLLLAGNLKGKSSILKIIKFCLTGNSKVRDDIYSWLKFIYLEFSINDDRYTSFIDISGSRQKSILFKLSLEKILNNEIKDEDKIFESNANNNYVDEMEDFFFKEFQFYNLQWTQKDSRKTSNDINTSNASWKTYYNYLNQESKDSSVMFSGGQDELCYQMLLGLKLTYPINRLKVKKEKKEHALAVSRVQKNKNVDSNDHLIKKIEAEIELYSKSLKELSLSKNISNNEELLKNRSTIALKITENQNEIRNRENEILKNRDKVESYRTDYKKNANEIEILKNLKNKTLKKINDLKEYLAIGIFFTNLDIQTCPHCNHSVDEDQKRKEKDSKECMLCNHSVKEPLTDTETYEEKIKEYEKDIIKIDDQIELYNKKNEQVEENGKLLNAKINEILTDIDELRSNELKLSKTYNEFGIQILKIEDEQLSVNNERLEKEKELAVLKYRLNELKTIVPSIGEEELVKYQKEIDLLQYSIAELKSIRLNENQDTILQLESLILQELKDLGIPAVEEVKIGENFKIKYKINGIFVDFDGVSEGEQLRAKLAFYLGLIQLNIQFGYGKHPRFLIIDSPAKEEGDKNFIIGLKKVIEDVNNKYGDELQIIICTAKRELENINVSGKKYIIPEDEFVF